MPAMSDAQRAAAHIAQDVKAGKRKAKPGSPSAKMAKMSSSSLEHFADTKGKLPKHTSDSQKESLEKRLNRALFS